jgi:hypothetical protein
MFNELTVTENGIIDRLKTLSGIKWTYCHGEALPKQAQDILWMTKTLAFYVARYCKSQTPVQKQ